MRHASPFHLQASGYTLAALMGLFSSFTVGYYAGRRQGTAGKSTVQARTLAQMQAQANQFDKLTFYSRLTEDGSKALPRPSAPKPVAAPGAVAAAPLKGAATGPAASSAAGSTAGSAAGPGLGSAPSSAASSAALKASRAPVTLVKEASRTNLAVNNAAKFSAQKAKGLAHVASPTPSERRPMAALATQHGAYTVQVSSFAHRPEARAFAAALTRQGFSPFVVTKKIPKKGTWYRVRVGRFETREAAVQAQHLLSRADINAWVVRSE